MPRRVLMDTIIVFDFCAAQNTTCCWLTTMNKTVKVKKQKRRGAPCKPEGERLRDGRLTVNFPPSRLPQLKRVADAQGLAVATFLRMAIFNKLDELDQESGLGANP